jgi:hypothetical protein
MKLYLTACLCVLAALAGLLNPGGPQEPSTAASVAGLPADMGLYYKGASKWTKLEKAIPVDVGNKGAYKAALGIGSLKYFNVYESGQSSMQISEPKPGFYVRVPADVDKQTVTLATKSYGMNPNDVGFVFFCARADIRDIKIVQLKSDKKKNYRGIEFKIIGGEHRYAESATHRVSVKRIDDGVILITPNADLLPGEYLLLICDALAWNFDFSVVAK